MVRPTVRFVTDRSSVLLCNVESHSIVSSSVSSSLMNYNSPRSLFPTTIAVEISNWLCSLLKVTVDHRCMHRNIFWLLHIVPVLCLITAKLFFKTEICSNYHERLASNFVTLVETYLWVCLNDTLGEGLTGLWKVGHHCGYNLKRKEINMTWDIARPWIQDI